MMRANIIHLVPDLGMGGLQKFCLNLARQQNKLDSVEIWLIGSSFDLCVVESDPNCRPLNLSLKWYNPRTHLLIWTKIAKLEAGSIVHTHGISLFFIFISALTQAKIKFVHTIHNLCQNEAGFIRRGFNHILFRFGFVVPVAISDEVASSFNVYYAQSRFELIYNGVPAVHGDRDASRLKLREINEVSFPYNAKVFLNVGRYDYQKNRSLLMSAFEKIFEYDNDCILLLVGGAADETNPIYTEVSAHDLTKKGKILMVGDVSNVHDFYLVSDYFISSSRFEGLPLALLEALSAGLVCIGTPAGGSTGILRKIGFLSPDFSPEKLAASAKKALSLSNNTNHDEIIDFYEKTYSMSVCAEKYHALYRAL